LALPIPACAAEAQAIAAIAVARVIKDRWAVREGIGWLLIELFFRDAIGVAVLAWAAIQTGFAQKPLTENG
jgi:hypothetical protein